MLRSGYRLFISLNIKFRIINKPGSVYLSNRAFHKLFVAALTVEGNIKDVVVAC